MENGIGKLKKALTDPTLSLLRELNKKRYYKSINIGFDLEKLLEKTGFEKQDLEEQGYEFRDYLQTKALITKKLNGISFSNWQEGVVDYLKTYEFVPPFYGRFPSSLQRWNLVRESFMEVFPIDIDKKPKTITQVAKENNRSKQQLTTEIRSLKDSLATNLVPQLLDTGKYIAPWIQEPDKYLDLPRLTKFVGIRGINSIVNDFGGLSNRDEFSNEKFPIKRLKEEYDRYEGSNYIFILGFGEKSMQGIRKYFEDSK